MNKNRQEQQDQVLASVVLILLDQHSGVNLEEHNNNKQDKQVVLKISLKNLNHSFQWERKLKKVRQQLAK
jgi:hypothetical protein